jgi:ABC-type proline/glycine betaine transport system permease subunit
MVEFGPAEVLDVLAVRPFFMYLIPTLMTNFIVGSFIGKTLADIVFFVPAILMYEVRKKHLR